DRKGFRVYGLAYWEDDPDGYPLYIFHNPAGGSQFVHKMNPDNGDTIFVADLGSRVAGNAAGAFITNQFDVYSWVFMAIANDGSDDRIDIWQLDRRRDWITIDPDHGVIPAGERRMFNLGITASLPPGDHNAQLVFLHDGVGGETVIDLIVHVLGGPPAPFNLLEPVNGDTLYTSEERTFTWEESIDPDPEEEVSYRLWFQTGNESTSTPVNDNLMPVSPDTGFFAVELPARFNWWVEAVSGGDTVECNDRFDFLLRPPQDVVTPEIDAPGEFSIRSIRPNPFNAGTRISYNLNRTSRTILRIIDFTGRVAAELDCGTQSAGYHTAVIDAAALPSGVYIARLTADGEARTGKLVCIK
ncbi:MAG TPA: T9SS type A sorting domain-containing protein, partial [Bacteroidetes bacterium]|nr:T9SS type A sorting domain-containing protein [Bacteroidota bacterium]